MAATIEKKMSNNIPDDVTFVILSKLHVKSLKRFSCVCKSWAQLFENPYFMSIYRTKLLSKHDNDNLSLLLKQITPEAKIPFMLSGDKFQNRVKLDWPPPFQYDNISCISTLGSAVNGILCLYKRSLVPGPTLMQKVVLWNPTTKEFKVIPPCSFDCPLGIVDIVLGLHGFGYDPVTNDYKIIRYGLFVKDNAWNGVVRPIIPESSWQIYSLKSNSWKKLDVEMPYSVSYGNKVYVNGMCHWWGHKGSYKECVLVSFNLTYEVFHITPLDWNESCEPWHRTLVVLNDSIAMITMYSGTTCFGISILGELGVKESWTEVFTFGLIPCVAACFGFCKKGNVIFKKNDDELALFNLSTQQVEEIGVKDHQQCCHIFIIYKESFLPIGGINS